MSLIRPVLRMCAVGALMNSTLAQDRVYDSDNTPLAEVLQGDAKPYIVVFTDDDNRPDVMGRDYYGATNHLTLVLEFGIASSVEGTVHIPATDAGMEVAIDLLEGQVLAAVLTDPHNPWAELVRRIILKVIRTQSKRGGSGERGARWAARQLMLVLDVIADPPPGEVIEEHHVIRDFAVLAAGNSPMSASAAIILSYLNNSPAPEWRQIQSRLVLTKVGMQGIGEAPIIDDDKFGAHIPVLDETTAPDEVPAVIVPIEEGGIVIDDVDMDLQTPDSETLAEEDH